MGFSDSRCFVAVRQWRGCIFLGGVFLGPLGVQLLLDVQNAQSKKQVAFRNFRLQISFWQRGYIPSLSLCLHGCLLQCLALMCKNPELICTYLLRRKKNESKNLVHFLTHIGLLSQFKNRVNQRRLLFSSCWLFVCKQGQVMAPVRHWPLASSFCPLCSITLYSLFWSNFAVH